MIFGLPEEENEKLSEKVTDVLVTIGEKPRLDACRLGSKSVGGKVRAVKVTLSSSAIVNQILLKARKLTWLLTITKQYLLIVIYLTKNERNSESLFLS